MNLDDLDMKYETIAEVYDANERIRKDFLDVVSGLSEEQANFPTEKGDWTIAGIAEHVSIVESGMIKICRKLLSKAEDSGKTADGKVYLSQSFIEKSSAAVRENKKVEAPEIVRPTGGRSIPEIIDALSANREFLNKIREKFETFDGSEATFPHPYFGPMNAHDWLLLLGEHKRRHTKQIERILSRP